MGQASWYNLVYTVGCKMITYLLKNLKSVSVPASVTVITTQTIKVCICNPENRQITDMVADFPYSITDLLQTHRN